MLTLERIRKAAIDMAAHPNIYNIVKRVFHIYFLKYMRFGNNQSNYLILGILRNLLCIANVVIEANKQRLVDENYDQRTSEDRVKYLDGIRIDLLDLIEKYNEFVLAQEE